MAAELLGAHRDGRARVAIGRASDYYGPHGTGSVAGDTVFKGDLLLQVPAPPAQRRRVAELLQRHHVHDVGYFAPGTFEQFPILDAD
jgi:hypothetical protein